MRETRKRKGGGGYGEERERKTKRRKSEGVKEFGEGRGEWLEEGRGE